MDNFYHGKKVLVTGGTGFVGTHFVEELVAAGASVRVPIHRREPALKNNNVEYIQGNLENLSDCQRLCMGVDYVFHAAGAVAAAAVNAENPMHAISVNLILAVRILEGAWRAGVKRILMFSSSTGYPESTKPIREEEFWSGPTYKGYFGYGEMRRYIERLSEFTQQKSTMGVALVRPTAVYGPYDNFDPVTSHVVPALIRKAVERKDPFEVWGDGKEVRDFLHVRDLVRGCMLMLEKKADCTPVNIGYGETLTVRQVIDAILKAADFVDAQLVFDTSKPTAIPFRMVDTTKASKILGFTPQISIENGIAETVKWFKDSQA